MLHGMLTRPRNSEFEAKVRCYEA